MLTDTHCHLDLNKFDSDREAVLERAWDAGIEHILIPGLTIESSRSVIRMTEAHASLHAAVGTHPTETTGWQVGICEELSALVESSPKVIAIGEIGLDYYWESAPHATQRRALEDQLNLAAKVSLPVVIHMREKEDAIDGPCAQDMLAILTAWVSRLSEIKHPLGDRPGVLHSFSGSIATAEQVIELGFFLGITGPVTWRKERQDLVRHMPLDCLLLETDAPFLAPVPWRGKRNEPALIALIADKIATCKECAPAEVARVTSLSARRLFAWK